nr:hypothetical protein [Tanacetum cinerariifolium]
FLKFLENSFEVLKLLENSVGVLKILKNKLESMKILKNKFESMKILENKLESLKLQKNQPVDGLVPLSIKKFTSESVFARLLKFVDSSAENELRAENEPSQQPKMSANVARVHDGDGGNDDRPPSYQMPISSGGKGTQKSNLGGRRVGRLHTRQETQNLRLKAITDKTGPVPIWFEFGDRETLMPLDDHAAHWANYLGELVREFQLHYPS